MTLIVCPLQEVEEAAKLYRPSRVLTLMAPQSTLPACAATPDAERLYLPFNDIAEPADGLTLATADQVNRLIDFGREWEDGAPMLVHCWAGISRSTAAAFIILTDRLGPGSERKVAQALRKASPTACPNRHLVRLADQALSRNGAMLEATDEIGRGLKAPAGKTFELKVR